MCSTPNPVESVFCVNCGARLVPLTAASLPEPKPAALPIKGLSLPAKPDVPSEPTPPAAPEPTQPAATEPPPAPAPAKEAVNDQEHVPDWLARLRTAPPADDEAAAPPADETTQLPEWATSRDESAAEQPADDSLVTPVPDWLKQAQAEPTQAAPAAPQADEEIPDWLRTPQAQVTAPPASGEKEELPDWLAQPNIGTSAPENTAAAEPTAPTGSEPIADVKPAETGKPENIATDKSITLTETPAAAAEPESVEELLASLEAAQPLAPALTEPQLPTQSARTSAEDDDIPDWLRAAAPETPVEPAEELEQPSPDQVPAWVAALKPAGILTPPLAAADSAVVEAAGPLQGMRGVLPLALAMAEPHPPTEAVPPASRADGGQIFEAILAAPVDAATPVGKPARRGWSVRPLIYVLLLLAVLVPFFLPFDLTGSTFAIAGTPAAEFYDTLQKVPAGSTVLLAFDYDPSLSGEMDLLANAIVRDLVKRRIKIIALSTLETGPLIAQRILDSAARETTNYAYGSSYLVLYLPGHEAGLAQLAATGLPTAADFVQNKPIGQFAVAAKIKTLRDVALLIDFAGAEEPLKAWVEQVQPRTGVRIAAAVSAGVEPKARAYRSANQLVATLAGLLGAAQYEVLSNRPQLAVISVNAQTAAQGVVVLVIILGNVVFWISRARGHAA